jgi:ribosome-associated protein
VSIDVREAAFGCANHLAGHNGMDTVILDLRKLSTWTDFFIVTSATSSTHLKAMARQVDEYLSPLGFDPLRKPKVAEDEEWCLVDYGDFVVHIMGARAREFYELETLWFGAELVKVAPPGP